MASTPRVDLTHDGRGGSIRYVEGVHTIDFSWEFAMSPAIALIFGPGARGWNATYPWAAGRQEGVYDVVGAEVVRQQVSGGSYDMDVDGGVVTVYRAARTRIVRESPSRGGRDPEPSTSTPPSRRAAPARDEPPRAPAWTRFVGSVPPPWASWPDEATTYDLAALAELSPADRDQAAALLRARGASWREVEALALLDVPAARAGVRAALVHHLSIDARLAAAEALHRHDPRFDLDTVLAREIRQLHRPSDGLARAAHDRAARHARGASGAALGERLRDDLRTVVRASAPGARRRRSRHR